MDLYLTLIGPEKGTITDNKGAKVPLETARQLWMDGQVADYNIAFSRLALEFDFNVEECLAFYDGMEGGA